mmetsp:Transcript_4995/g.8682  ORF Transcript_4995/g.8682 Transcript_4995/m.8682 type:complete len:245 (+) Transcript_4995:55-789(+)
MEMEEEIEVDEESNGCEGGVGEGLVEEIDVLDEILVHKQNLNLQRYEMISEMKQKASRWKRLQRLNSESELQDAAQQAREEVNALRLSANLVEMKQKTQRNLQRKAIGIAKRMQIREESKARVGNLQAILEYFEWDMNEWMVAFDPAKQYDMEHECKVLSEQLEILNKVCKKQQEVNAAERLLSEFTQKLSHQVSEITLEKSRQSSFSGSSTQVESLFQYRDRVLDGKRRESDLLSMEVRRIIC